MAFLFVYSVTLGRSNLPDVETKRLYLRARCFALVIGRNGLRSLVYQSLLLNILRCEVFDDLSLSVLSLTPVSAMKSLFNNGSDFTLTNGSSYCTGAPASDRCVTISSHRNMFLVVLDTMNYCLNLLSKL